MKKTALTLTLMCFLLVDVGYSHAAPTNVSELSSINGLDTDGTDFWLTGVYQEGYKLYKANESGTILNTIAGLLT